MVYFAQQDYKQALNSLKTALQLNPKLPASVRCAMGICFFNLGKYYFARIAFERALQLDAKNARARHGLAVLALLRGDFEEHFQQLENAFLADQNDVPTLLALAEHYLLQKNFDLARKLAYRGLKCLPLFSTFINTLRGDANNRTRTNDQMIVRNDHLEVHSRLHSVLGAAEHWEKRFENAHKYYLQATDINKKNLLA
jgi:tetratricopeptide (TPR) repeat protein